MHLWVTIHRGPHSQTGSSKLEPAHNIEFGNCVSGVKLLLDFGVGIIYNQTDNGGYQDCQDPDTIPGHSLIRCKSGPREINIPMKYRYKHLMVAAAKTHDKWCQFLPFLCHTPAHWSHHDL